MDGPVRYKEEYYQMHRYKKQVVLICYVLCLVAQACPTLCNPMDCRPPGFSIHGISQARTLEWVLLQGYLPDPGIEPGSSALQADSLPTELQGNPCRFAMREAFLFSYLGRKMLA